MGIVRGGSEEGGFQAVNNDSPPIWHSTGHVSVLPRHARQKCLTDYFAEVHMYLLSFGNKTVLHSFLNSGI